MHTRTQEKGAVTSQETDPDLPVSVQESLGCGCVVAYCRVRALSAVVCAWDLLKEVAIIFITSTILASGQSTGREHSPAHQQKIG